MRDGLRLLVAAAAIALVAGVILRGQAGDRTLLRQTPSADRRLALVVGNDGYRGAELKNARNDARAIARALEDVGFQVTVREDATRRDLAAAVAAFGDSLRPDDVALFYFAGHGAQVGAENFLIPVDFQGRSAAEIRLDGVRASEVQQLLQAARVSMLILDACRDNPFSGTRAGGGGLAAMEVRGSLIAFATGAGQTAADNASGSNGLFTQELLKTLREPGLTAQELFQRVRRGVFTASNGTQFPAVYDGLLGDFVFRAGATSPTESATRPSVGDAETLFWAGVAAQRGNASETELIEEYQRRFGPDGQFSTLARARLAELTSSTRQRAAVDQRGQQEITGLGMSVRELTSADRQRLRIPGNPSGLLIVAVAPDDPSARSGLVANDVILRNGRQEISGVAQAIEEFGRVQTKGTAFLRIVRNGQEIFVTVTREDDLFEKFFGPRDPK